MESEPDAAAPVFGARLDLARAYVTLLATDAIERGLIGPREAGRLWTRHVLNCAVAAEYLPQGARVVDVGSGAGLPGIPLAIARPDCRFDLVEPLERRAGFLIEVIQRLGLDDTCRVIRGRAEQVAAGEGQQLLPDGALSLAEIDPAVTGADVVTSRAVAPLGKLAGWSAPLGRLGGSVLALKGASAGEELDRDAAQLRAAGLADIEVHTVGLGVVDPPTWVVTARIAEPARGRSGRRGRRP